MLQADDPVIDRADDKAHIWGALWTKSNLPGDPCRLSLLLYWQ